MKNNFSYIWNLPECPVINISYHGKTVFSCFAGGGGSSMGYKLAGYNVLGCNEIDKKTMDCYIRNLNPKYYFLSPIQEFKNQENLPDELFHLDILDGSPPCSSFSMVGNREKDWGKKKKFKEGQQEQILDILFFDFLDLGERLQPKIIIVENVKGLLMGNAIKYVVRIKQKFNEIGYQSNYILLDSSKMGVPQRRQRVFFYGIRNDLYKYIPKIGFLKDPYLNLKFSFPKIRFKEISDGLLNESNNSYQKNYNFTEKYFSIVKPGQSISSVHPKGSCFSHIKMNPNDVAPTLVAVSKLFHYIQNRKLTKNEVIKISSFPVNYDFNKQDYNYICGMSVPPVMMAQIAHQIKLQWIDKFSKEIKK